METTEKIVESYCRYVKGWFTISNIKCAGQFEIDLLAVESKPGENIKRFHIESSVSISGSFSKLTDKPFSVDELKERVKQPAQRMTIGHFIHRKFGSSEICAQLEKLGFVNGNYSKIIVVWDWEENAKKRADSSGITLWNFRTILKEIADSCRKTNTYFMDDTLRTIQLFERRNKE